MWWLPLLYIEGQRVGTPVYPCYLDNKLSHTFIAVYHGAYHNCGPMGIKMWRFGPIRTKDLAKIWPNWPQGQYFPVCVAPTGVTQNTLWIVHIVTDDYSVIVICQSFVSCEDNVIGTTFLINHTQMCIIHRLFWSVLGHTRGSSMDMEMLAW